MPTRDTRTPMTRPITAPVGEAGQDAEPPRPCRAGWRRRRARRRATPAVKPADRSISPISRTKTRPIAMTMTGALWMSRLAKLNELVKVSGRSEEKTMTQHDQAEDGRQRADVAAADPGDVLAEGVGQGHLRRLPGRRAVSSAGASCLGLPSRLVPGSSSSGVVRAASVTATCPASSTSEPPVMSSTTSECVDVLGLDLRRHPAEVEDRDVVGDLRGRRSCCG